MACLLVDREDRRNRGFWLQMGKKRCHDVLQTMPVSARANRLYKR